MSASVLALSEVNGKRFGRLVAVNFDHIDRGTDRVSFRKWLFRCDCGNELIEPLFKATRGYLTSCGCEDRESARKLFAVRGNRRHHIRPTIYKPEIVKSDYAHVIVSDAEKSVVAKWADDGLFGSEHIFVVEEARALWALIGRPTHDLFDSDDPEDQREGLLAERAKALLRNCRHLVGVQCWNIFENVVRWNEPRGFVGSRIMEGDSTNTRAKAIVADVADRIAKAGLLDETGFSRLVGE